MIHGEKSLIDVKSIAGPDIKELHFSGKNIFIADFCNFINVDERMKQLPKLEKVTFENVEIHNFRSYQDCDHVHQRDMETLSKVDVGNILSYAFLIPIFQKGNHFRF